MGKMSELSLAITELRNAAQSLISAADSLADLLAGSGGIQAEEQPKTESSTPAEKPLTLESVRAVLAVVSLYQLLSQLLLDVQHPPREWLYIYTC
jgi:hypothetical protein